MVHISGESLGTEINQKRLLNPQITLRLLPGMDGNTSRAIRYLSVKLDRCFYHIKQTYYLRHQVSVSVHDMYFWKRCPLSLIIYIIIIKNKMMSDHLTTLSIEIFSY